MLADWIGSVAGLLTTAAFIPQAVKTWRTRSTKDISLGMFVLFCSGVVLWLGYGFMIESWPVIIANGVTLALASVILVIKIANRGQEPPDGAHD